MADFSKANAISPGILAAISVAVLGGYLQLVEWVDLHPWNDVRNGNGQEALDLVLAGVTVLLVVGLCFLGRLAALVASLVLAAWIYLQVVTWWVPYFVGASPGWQRTYERWFAETIQVLPRTEDHLPPDANHLTLHVLLIITFALSLRALIKRSG